MPFERFGVQAQGVLKQLGWCEGFQYAKELGRALLRHDDFLDVFEMADQPLDVGEQLTILCC